MNPHSQTLARQTTLQHNHARYDGDGRRVQKSGGTLYWYGTGPDPLDETDLTGSITNSTFKEYIHFGSQRIARRDSTNAVNYYFSDHLGTARIVANSSGSVLDDSDFYPFGGERVITSSSGNHYKFTGKERDSESGFDLMNVRNYAATAGRFSQADPVLVTPVRAVDPQQLNLYAYARNDPMRYTDPTGMIIDTDSLSDKDSEKWQKVVDIANQQDENGNYLHPVLHEILDTLQSDPRTFVIENTSFGAESGTAGAFTVTNFTADGNDFTRATIQLDFKKIEGMSHVTSADLVPGFNKFQGLFGVKNEKILRLAEIFGHEGAHGIFGIRDPAQAVAIQRAVNAADAALAALPKKGRYPLPPDVQQKLAASEKALVPTERFAQQTEQKVNQELQPK